MRLRILQWVVDGLSLEGPGHGRVLGKLPVEFPELTERSTVHSSRVSPPQKPTAETNRVVLYQDSNDKLYSPHSQLGKLLEVGVAQSSQPCLERRCAPLVALPHAPEDHVQGHLLVRRSNTATIACFRNN